MIKKNPFYNLDKKKKEREKRIISIIKFDNTDGLAFDFHWS